MGGEVSNFEGYRKMYDAQPAESHSLEAFGITYEEVFEAAMANPQSVVVEVEGIRMPILTPLRNLPDRNLGLYRRLAEETLASVAKERQPVGDIYYYSHLGLNVADSEQVAAGMVPVVRELAASRGVLTYDCSRANAECTGKEVQALLRQIGGVACMPLVRVPKHYHYVMRLDEPKGERRQERPLDFPALYHDALKEGAIGVSAAIDVVGKLSEADFEQIAYYYARRHARLTRSDATDAGFSPDSLHRVLTDPQYNKVVYRDKRQVVSLALVADARYCPWIDQSYIKAADPDCYERGRTLIGIGAISDPDASQGTAQETINVTTRLMAYAGANIVLAIATDNVSNRYIPRLSVQSLRLAGLDPHPIEAVNGVEFQALVLQADTQVCV